MLAENIRARRGFSIGTDLFGKARGQRVVLPFQRPIVVTLVLTAVALIMTVPAVITCSEAVREWRSLDTLFDLVGALFLQGWLLGWSVGLFIIYALLAVMVAGQETLIRASRSAASGRDADRPVATHEPERGSIHRAGMPAVTVREAPENPAGFWTPSTLALLAANLVPVAGVLLLQWNLGTLMALFRAESGIIGLYNLVKLFVVQRWLALLTGLFFIGHFGAFMAIHCMFVYELFVARESGAGSSLPEVGQFFYALWPALFALLCSHGVSFVYHFLGRCEYCAKTAREQMSEPYRRVVVMHVTLIIGGGLSLLLGSPVAALLLLVMLKIATDIHAHRQQHRH